MTTSPSDWVGPRPDDPKPIIYLSGVALSAGILFEALYKETGYKYYCLTYLYCSKDAPRFDARYAKALKFYLDNNLRVFMDSGAHSFQELAYAKMGVRGNSKTSALSRMERSKKVNEMIDAYAKNYAAWLQTFPKKTFDFYVNLDYVINAPIIYKMLHRLQDSGIRPIPVYHGDASIDWMRRYVDEGHKLIGIGWNAAANGRPQRRRYYDNVFDFAAKYNLYLHGFACTGTDAFAYPWYSVDSTTWLKTAAFGGIVNFTKDSQNKVKFGIYHVSERKLPEELRSNKDLIKFVEARGFKLKDLRMNLKDRALYNVKAFSQVSQDNIARTSRIAWKGNLC